MRLSTLHEDHRIFSKDEVAQMSPLLKRIGREWLEEYHGNRDFRSLDDLGIDRVLGSGPRGPLSSKVEKLRKEVERLGGEFMNHDAPSGGPSYGYVSFRFPTLDNGAAGYYIYTTDGSKDGIIYRESESFQGVSEGNLYHANAPMDPSEVDRRIDQFEVDSVEIIKLLQDGELSIADATELYKDARNRMLAGDPETQGLDSPIFHRFQKAEHAFFKAVQTIRAPRALRHGRRRLR
jgi:hypothetical protein